MEYPLNEYFAVVIGTSIIFLVSLACLDRATRWRLEEVADYSGLVMMLAGLVLVLLAMPIIMLGLVAMAIVFVVIVACSLVWDLLKVTAGRAEKIVDFALSRREKGGP